ncbi:NAD-dependent epimerase/dehydratase family protein [Rhodococcus sp. PAMC28707]|uniref:NAD(P)H-binding protein n=1 Tax=unclassified Rhodococcus (in: high G+C Gram-positive bacteria) TaxID=192944 RepID=UPI00109E1044|nr:MULTISPECIES: NAD(P)H-binding protein [unclassified Rhodococcus (in: high G+C Gram-positive bacteria)]QCB50346.1 NAD-dependent epimerase/dehydratase family protein [Rhodococcus sp. PAMC28705]QCB57962.1 NAD-dependent epimerase/dehydratase family protein [Rhodococcus sp. PAMC28707]
MTDLRVVIAGGHGKIAQHLIQVLTAHGDRAVALIRNPEHASEVESLGALPAVLDLETATVDEVAAVLAGADAAVFAAGSGGSGGAARKDSVDRAGSVLLADAAERAGVKRFVQISSFGAGEPVADDAEDSWKAYMAAKTAAEEDLKARTKLDWTILRPGGLTDEDATAHIALSEPPLERGTVPRGDVAKVIAALLETPSTIGKTLMLTSGGVRLEDAL